VNTAAAAAAAGAEAEAPSSVVNARSLVQMPLGKHENMYSKQ